jgi:NAD(P)-dependent dehydrogenase (short-subunit alcohol dehydrogenase family)
VGWRSGSGLEGDFVAEGRELATVNGGLHTAVRPPAMELAPLRVNAVAPGVIDMPLVAGMPGPVRDNVVASAARRRDRLRTHHSGRCRPVPGCRRNAAGRQPAC